MQYIPDKKLYSAVMFALKMCPSLQYANDDKISVASNYYHVEYDKVLEIVRNELWERAKVEAKNDKKRWHSIYNPLAPKLLNTGACNNYVLICPSCGRYYSCNANCDFQLSKLYVSYCSCGFSDEYQRKFIRKDIYNYLTHKEV